MARKERKAGETVPVEQSIQNAPQQKRKVLEKHSNTWTAKELCNKMEKGTVVFDSDVQRSMVWDTQRKSLLIHSMVYGYGIPPMYFVRRKDGIYECLDGKQRSNTIYEYIKGEFALHVSTPPVCDEDGAQYDIERLTYDDLPEWAQDSIKDYPMTVYYYENMTEQEIKEFFRRLNNGKPLSSIELTRVGATSLSAFQSLAKHDAIQAAVTKAGKRSFTDELIAMQLYHLMTESEPDFSTSTFRAWTRTVKVDENVINKIISGLDMYYEFFNGIEKDNKRLRKIVKSRTNFVAIAYYCCLASEAGISSDEVDIELRAFFAEEGNPSINESYNDSVKAGSAKASSVKTRKEIMESFISHSKGTADIKETEEDLSGSEPVEEIV